MVTIFNRKAVPPDRVDKPGMSRRDLLKRGGTLSLGALLVIGGNAIIHPQSAWGLEVSNLKPETMAALLQLARDVYPHDQIPDRFYAIAIKAYDTKAGTDADHKKLIENGIAELDKKAGKGGYIGIGWEDERLTLLRGIEETPFFQTVRGGLVTSLYNQKDIWPYFGYEGESYSKGGYIARGFDDIEWL